MLSEESVPQKKDVVIVEDDRYVQDFLRFTLEQQGYGVHTAEDGQWGLKLIRDFSPVLVVLDLMLPKMDGFTILKHIEEEPATAQIPVVVLSAYAANESTRKMIQSHKNVREVFTKPVRSREFVTRLKQILGD